MVALKVYKKTTPNGKMTVYLEKRDFVDRGNGNVDAVEGIVYVEKDYLKSRKVFGQVITTYRYGREEDEVMGLKFSKELLLVNCQIVPPSQDKISISKVQKKLLEKLGENAFPFVFHFPENSPSSVFIQTGETGKPLGVDYKVRAIVVENADDVPHKRSSAILTIKKLQFCPLQNVDKLPSAVASKSFTFSSGRVNLEVNLDKELYYHEEKVAVTIVISNTAKKSVKNMKIHVMQVLGISMTNSQLIKAVAGLETREGCPVTPGRTFSKTIELLPAASSNKDKRGIALDGHLKDDDVNLASSTIMAAGKGAADGVGVLVSYLVRVKLGFGTLGGELQADVPLKLVHRDQAQQPEKKAEGLNKLKSVDKAHYEDSNVANDDDNMEFEDYYKGRIETEAEE